MAVRLAPEHRRRGVRLCTVRIERALAADLATPSGKRGNPLSQAITLRGEALVVEPRHSFLVAACATGIVVAMSFLRLPEAGLMDARPSPGMTTLSWGDCEPTRSTMGNRGQSKISLRH